MKEPKEDEFVQLELPELKLPLITKERNSNNDFMVDLVAVANDVRKAVILIAGIVSQKEIEPEKLDILRGHLVRIYKLYDTFTFLIVERRTEIAFIVLRSLAETIINLNYLIKYFDTDIYKKYKRASLAYEKQLENIVLRNIQKRNNKLPIEKRMLESINKTYKRSHLDNLEEKELEKTKWGLEKKHLEISGKAEDVGLYPIYELVFKISSHYVHGSWHELDFDHLERDEDKMGFRLPKFEYATPRPQLIETISVLVLQTLEEYLSIIAFGEGQAKEIKSYLDKIVQWLFEIADKHEEYLSSKK